MARIDDDPYSFIKRALSLIALIVFVRSDNVRSFLIPDSFGRYGDYRADHLDEMREQIPVHSDGKICAECHDENAATKSEWWPRQGSLRDLPLSTIRPSGG